MDIIYMYIYTYVNYMCKSEVLMPLELGLHSGHELLDMSDGN